MIDFFNNKKWLKLIIKSIIIIFAIIGFTFTAVFFAVKLNLTKTGGGVDFNDRYFKNLSEKKFDTSNNLKEEQLRKNKLFSKLLILNNYYPVNSQLIYENLIVTKDISIAEKMFDALLYKIKDNKELTKKIDEIDSSKNNETSAENKMSVYEWMNNEQWEVLKEAIIKDQKVIDSVSNLTGVSSRMIVSVLIGEQIRLFHSSRESFKRWMQPLKMLTNETKFSLGVTGIKEETALKTEKYLKDSSSIFYLGSKYKNLLDYNNNDNDRIYKRLTSETHFYSYLYSALCIKQICQQWKKSGFDITERPEIVATLFNLGYEVSKPKANPETGGSKIKINDKIYTFGSIAFDFYYSGELYEQFPVRKYIADINL